MVEARCGSTMRKRWLLCQLGEMFSPQKKMVQRTACCYSGGNLCGAFAVVRIALLFVMVHHLTRNRISCLWPCTQPRS